MRVLIATGGTGGHLFPAQRLADELEGEVLFVGKGLLDNPYFSHERYPFVEIPSGRRPLSLGRGILAARRVIKRFQPDVIVGFGSLYAAPTMVSRRRKVQYEPNAWPGRTTRFFSRSSLTGICFPDTSKYLKGKTCLVEPLIPRSVPSKEEALRHFGLEPGRTTLLVFGGSQGADALKEPAAHLVRELEAQVIHLYGTGPAPSYESSSYTAPFEQRMDLAWAACDLSLTRAGASTCLEQIHHEVPGLLVPWRGAMEDHQEKNLEAMVNLGLAMRFSDLAKFDRKQIVKNIRAFKALPKKHFKELVNG